MTATLPIYGYIQGAYYAGYGTKGPEHAVTGKMKPAVAPVEKTDKSKHTDHRH